MEKKYIAIDLKSFYASVECVERGLDPLDTNLVVADKSRTEKTICLAVSPSLKACGVSGRPRLFEVAAQTADVNAVRRYKAPRRKFRDKSCIASELKADPSLELSYITAVPRMALYIEYSTRIYNVYLKYIAPEDIHIYSIDEVFIDATAYLDTYGMTAHELAMTMIRDVLKTTGITATAGIGTNLYLCKIAMDIVAKRMPPDKDGVRIAELDEMSYRKLMWEHRPLTDFWRVGRGYASRLEHIGIFTMGDIARFSASEFGEKALYKMFGVNAELLIDHAWGWEPCTIADIKSYRPEVNSISSGQVLQEAAEHDTARLITWEMADMLSLDLVGKGLVTDQLTLTIGYDVENLRREDIIRNYTGKVVLDHYGRPVPAHAHGTVNLAAQVSSSKLITEAAMELFDRITDGMLLVRRITICANRVVPAESVREELRQLDFFTDFEEEECRRSAEKAELRREKNLQLAMLRMKERYGKNAVLRGTNLCEGATARSRNRQIGGHRA
ncbi:MAG: DNA methylase [Ruminococcus sp.]|uniref:Y-family DNA polymerase n=1 Tax=Ruminococcus sp. TaxID=41978 RepID=UPI0025EE2331|nr:DNA methylase [Ruminococcus sp.]MCR5600714.1 DNA methylase [Ruminococcus sp.]